MKDDIRYLVNIKIPNKIFHVNGKTIRSPFEMIVTENDLKLIKVKIHSLGINSRDYSIEVYKEKLKQFSTEIEDKEPLVDLPLGEATVEELETKSTLDRILNDEEDWTEK